MQKQTVMTRVSKTALAALLGIALMLEGAALIYGAQALAPVGFVEMAHASTVITKKAGWYTGSLTGKKSSIYKAKISGNKLVIYGKLRRTKSYLASGGATLAYAKRVFKVTNATKYRGIGGIGLVAKYSKKAFSKLVSAHNGLEMNFKVKGGKVVYANLYS